MTKLSAYPPQQQEAKRSNLFGSILVALVGVVAFLLAIAGLNSLTAPAAEPVAAAPVAGPVTAPAADPVDDRLAAIQADLDRRMAAHDARVNASARDFVTDGTWEVGNEPGQMVPGTYRTSRSDCYWARSSDATGDAESILANGFTDGPAVVTVKASDGTFETSGGCMWSQKR